MCVNAQSEVLPNCSAQVGVFNWAHFAEDDPHFLTIAGAERPLFLRNAPGPKIRFSCDMHQRTFTYFLLLKILLITRGFPSPFR